jgi:hypothetical protein
MADYPPVFSPRHASPRSCRLARYSSEFWKTPRVFAGMESGRTNFDSYDLIYKMES